MYLLDVDAGTQSEIRQEHRQMTAFGLLGAGVGCSLVSVAFAITNILMHCLFKCTI